MLFFCPELTTLLAGFVLFLSSGWLTSVENQSTPEGRRQAILAIAQDFGTRLAIAEPIDIQVSTDKQRLVSVRRLNDEQRSFLITFDDEFLAALNEEELRAAVAHELGHVWLFTRRPYLQTEALANRKAVQLVSGESLDRLYLKVSEFSGKSGKIQGVSEISEEALR